MSSASPHSEDAYPESAENRAHPENDHHRVHEPPLDHGKLCGLGTPGCKGLLLSMVPSTGLDRPRMPLDPISLSSAIYEGPSDSTAHQPCPEGGQGTMGGCQGEGTTEEEISERDFRGSP